MSDKTDDQPCESILQRIRKDILPIFERAVKDDEVIFKNPNLVNCWEMKDCKRTDCDGMKQADTRCWQIAGTFCGGKVQGSFVEKHDNCKDCEVFKRACPTLVDELGENLNNMLFLIRKQKRQNSEKAKRIEHLNNELISTLERLDSRNMEIQELVITDKLTGLFNRHYLFTMLEDELSRCSRRGYIFSLMMMDIDDFKKFNDTFGHLFGDKMLSALGIMIKTKIRKIDRAFRFGGEEFMVILPETDLTIAWAIAERIRMTFAELKFPVNDEDGESRTFNSTISIGLTRYDPSISINKLIEQADEAMYAAKSKGKNMVIRYDQL